MSKIDLISNDWIELVFAGRNHAYGAYQLRKSTGKRNLWSMVFVAAVAALAYVGLAAYNTYQEQQKARFEAEMEASLLEQKKEAKVEKKTEAPKVELQKVEKVKSSIAFTPPVIKKDSEVKPEEEMKTQDELNENKTAIGAFDVKGNDEEGGTVLKAVEEIATPEPPKHEEENKVFDVVEQMPSFPGGPSALMAYLSSHVKYPAVAEENGIQGRVTVQFVVEKDGSVTDVKTMKSVDPSLDREAERVVRSMPKWIPGKQNGSAVRVKYFVPVVFRLQ
ncbi:MAG: TonB family protein [Bacteroidales bacterium]|nr:TonB family protein [Bacteroidales bacterium]MDY3356711.1 TonB family protein [Prevotella sp.]MCI7762865.1 TonB family protein [Bacteroidales bacterium]MDD5814066.1 TonB family protein [Bacteroidales bacterium]MDD6028139.1 TonB family protein [Bacteroidales bacterium]